MLALYATGARAASAEYTILVDADARPNTGCQLATVKGPFDGVEFALVTTVETGAASARVTGVARRDCVGGALGPSVVFDGGSWLVGLAQGGGVAAIETWAPLWAFGGATSPRIAVVSSGGGGTDAIVASSDGEAPRLRLAGLGGGAAPVPTMPGAALALLAGLLAWLGARRALARAVLRTGLSIALSATLAAGVVGLAWAASVALDGSTGDWNGLAPLATDARGNAPADADLTAVYAQHDAARVYFRIDADVVLEGSGGQQAPRANAGPDQTITLPSTAVLAGSATDDGLPAPPVLSFSWTQVAGPAAATIGAPGSSTTEVQFPQAGSYRFRLTVSDGALDGSDEADVEVRAEANARPTLAALPDRTIAVGESLSIRLAADDANVKDSLVYSIDEAPAGAAFAPAGSPILVWPGAGTPSTHRFAVRVRDAAGAEDAKAFDVHVVARNRAPVIDALPDATLPTGGRFRRAVGASDPDGDTVTIALIDGPSAMTLADGVLDWSAGSADLGEHVVTVRATDPSGAGAYARFALRVVPGAVPVARGDRYEVKQGATLDVAAPGVLANDADPDGESLSARRASDPDKGTLEAFGGDGAFRYVAPPTLPPPPALAARTLWQAGPTLFVTAFAVGDLDDDSTPDVVHLAYNTRIRAVRGGDGSTLWALESLPPPYADCGGVVGGRINFPVVADVDDDGHADVVLHVGCNRDWPGTGSLAHERILALDGRTGAIKWLSPNLLGFAPGEGNAAPAVAEGMTLSVARLSPGESPTVLGGFTDESFSSRPGCPWMPGAQPTDRRCRAVFALDGRDGSIRRTYYHAPADQATPAMGFARHGERFEAPIVADFGGDVGVAVLYEGSMWRADGAHLRSVGETRDRPNAGRVAVADIDGDGGLDIVTLDMVLGRARAERSDGTVLWNVPAAHCRDLALGGHCAITIGDVDADGAPEVVLAGYDRIAVHDRRGRLRWARFIEGTVPYPLGCDNRPAIYDLDGDGVPEVAMRMEQTLLLLRGTTGRELANIPIGAPSSYTAGYTCSMPMDVRVADVDGDGAADLLVGMSYDGISGANNGGIWAFTSANDPWMPARGVFNAWDYRVAAIGDDLSVPAAPPGAAALPADNLYAQQTQLATRPDLRERSRTRFTYAAQAGGRESAPANVDIDILPPNRPPVFTSTPPTAWGLVNFTYALTATDPDSGDTLTFSLVHADDFAFESTTTLGASDHVLRKASAQPGVHLFVVRVTDSQGAFTEQSMVVDMSNATAAVPALVGEAEGDATGAILAASLVLGARDEVHDAAVAGSVIAQTPAAGSIVPRGSAVDLVVSKGPQPRLVPNVGGRTLTAAAARLAAQGFAFGTIAHAYHDDVPRGDVLAQTPAAGSEAVPGPVDVVVSGGTGLEVSLSNEAVLAGATIGITVRASAPDGTSQSPPPVTLAIAPRHESEGDAPTFVGTTIQVPANARGTYDVVVTETGGAGRVARASFAVLDPGTVSEPPQQAWFTDMAETLVLLGDRTEALDAARLANDEPAMRALLASMIALWKSRHSARNLEDLSFSTPLAPSGGFLPPVASLPGFGFAPTVDDALLVGTISTLDDAWAELRAMLGEDPGDAFALLAALDVLDAPTRSFARLEPSAYGVVDERHAYKALLAREIPGALDRWFAAVDAALAAGKMKSDPGPHEKFGLPLTLAEVSSATSIQVLLAKKLYLPAVKHVAWSAAALAAAHALQSFFNTGALEGIITGASLSFHVFEAPYSTIEVLGMDPRHPQNAQVLLIGPAAVEAVTGLKDQIVAFGKKLTDPDPLKKMKNLNDLRKHVGDIRDALGKAIDQGFESYRVFDTANFGADLSWRGCVLSQAPDCNSLVYKRGLMPVHVCKEGELCLPAPVIAIVTNTVDGGVGIAPYNFLPAFKAD